MINSNSIIVQAGSETTYGNLPSAMTAQYAYASQSFKPILNKKDEGVKTGGKSVGKVATMSIKAEGSLQVLARPDDVGLFLKHFFGVEAEPVLVASSTGAYTHTFKAIGNNLSDTLKSIAFAIDRKTDVYGYVGCKINTLAFSASPEDYLKLDLGLVCRDEVDTATLTTGLTKSPMSAFKFRNGKIKVEGVEVASVDSIKFDGNNNLDGAIQTTSTGIYLAEPECGAREFKTEFSAIYGTNTEALSNMWYKTDNVFSLDIVFTSDDKVEASIPYSLTIKIPNNQLSDSSRDEGDTLKHNFSAVAIEEGADELIIIELVNGKATKY